MPEPKGSLKKSWNLNFTSASFACCDHFLFLAHWDFSQSTELSKNSLKPFCFSWKSSFNKNTCILLILLNVFYPTLSFPESWHCNKPWKIAKGRSVLIHSEKDQVPKVGSSSAVMKVTICAGIHLGSSSPLSWDLRGKGKLHNYADVHAVHCAINKKILCLWSRNLLFSPSIHEIMAANLSTCK